MSGAAGIAAAKNRRGRSDNSTRFPPPTSCSVPNKSFPPPPVSTKAMPRAGSAIKEQASMPLSNMVDPDTLQILGPMPPAQILKLHEQRLNRVDEKLSQCLAQNSCMQGQEPVSFTSSQVHGTEEADEEYREECFSRIGELESKLSMLEEVIMNLQNKLTVVQNFSMESNLEISKLKSRPEPVPVACMCSQTCSSTQASSTQASSTVQSPTFELLPAQVLPDEVVDDLLSVIDVTDLSADVDVSI